MKGKACKDDEVKKATEAVAKGADVNWQNETPKDVLISSKLYHWSAFSRIPGTICDDHVDCDEQYVRPVANPVAVIAERHAVCTVGAPAHVDHLGSKSPNEGHSNR